ncbi:MAG TPA: hypothetical protein VF331_12310 [Polyangiales bacterium]
MTDRTCVPVCGAGRAGPMLPDGSSDALDATKPELALIARHARTLLCVGDRIAAAVTD